MDYFNKLDGVAPLMTDPPPTSSTTLYDAAPPLGGGDVPGGVNILFLALKVSE